MKNNAEAFYAIFKDGGNIEGNSLDYVKDPDAVFYLHRDEIILHETSSQNTHYEYKFKLIDENGKLNRPKFGNVRIIDVGGLQNSHGVCSPNYWYPTYLYVLVLDNESNTQKIEVYKESKIMDNMKIILDVISSMNHYGSIQNFLKSKIYNYKIKNDGTLEFSFHDWK